MVLSSSSNHRRVTRQDIHITWPSMSMVGLCQPFEDAFASISTLPDSRLPDISALGSGVDYPCSSGRDTRSTSGPKTCGVPNRRIQSVCVLCQYSILQGGSDFDMDLWRFVLYPSSPSSPLFQLVWIASRSKQLVYSELSS